ncbi:MULTISPECIES: tyrosine-type recombinase/integrase [Catenuloplanes]|uniref:Integrase n=1 Tax=Catenuloplanes niger TaxID=587534 RepID=A0AAE3ZPX8_9ACTN|nr:integrase [Catenuloplanes niger]MDR7322937.1 integrase [Catenuloplanes niger]
MNLSYDVRIYKIEVRTYKAARGGKARTSYRVRWAVAGEKFGDTFATLALAESFRSKLVTNQREGVAFDTATGLPEPMAREQRSITWLQLAVAYAEMKWPRVSAHHRRGIAETLTGATMALLVDSRRGAPADGVLRQALNSYVFVKPRRTGGPPPAELADAVAWLDKGTVKLSELTEAARVRKVLDSLALKLDGTAAAASTVARKRAVFSGALLYGVEEGHLDTHPMERVKWIAPEKDEAVDRRVVVNPHQGGRLLDAVRKRTPELTAFFGSMYLAALRPEEALHLHKHEYERPREPGGWGWLHLGGAVVEVGTAWTDDGSANEYRSLKHRSRKTVRSVPAEPDLCKLFDWHIETYPPGPDGRLFVTRRGPGGMYLPATGRPVTANARLNAWHGARQAALTPDELAAGLAPVPYSLRHACVSSWLNAGVSPTLVAEWAGHSVRVLLNIYAKCLYGEEEAAFRRILAFRKEHEANKPG